MTAAVDTTRLVERLAAQLATGAVRHPVAAALAIACRGNAAMDIVEFAGSIGLDVPTVEACEAGDVAFGDLPPPLVADHEGLDLLALADLDASYTAGRSAQVM
jgi:hypothetical protein